MTQQTSGYSASAGSYEDNSTKDVAREQAGEVGRTTGAASQRVAGTAAEQAGQVGQEARRQARDLLGQARGQVTEQARNGQQQATDGLRSLAKELHEMADGGEQQGPASDLAKQAADKLGDLAEWLGRREPGDLVQEVRALARRRPGAFLLGAAAAGVLAGRLTRGAVDANRDTSSGDVARWDTTSTPASAVTYPPAPIGTIGLPGRASAVRLPGGTAVSRTGRRALVVAARTRVPAAARIRGAVAEPLPDERPGRAGAVRRPAGEPATGPLGGRGADAGPPTDRAADAALGQQNRG